MRPPHILLLNKNVGELKRQLADVLGVRGTRAFEREVQRNVAQLFALGEEHFAFAQRLRPRHWRQIVSRTYYGAYLLSKALRLAVGGHYSSEVRDHEKIGELPDDFPERNTYSNRLRLLRDDRNLSDYDHTVREVDLALPRADAQRLVQDFISHARVYLNGRNFRV
jgi:hypothetical protein